jgi:hypothetical protein
MGASIGSAGATIAENLDPGNWYLKVAAITTADVLGVFSTTVSQAIQ